jgi:hypothetical protein
MSWTDEIDDVEQHRQQRLVHLRTAIERLEPMIRSNLDDLGRKVYPMGFLIIGPSFGTGIPLLRSFGRSLDWNTDWVAWHLRINGALGSYPTQSRGFTVTIEFDRAGSSSKIGCGRLSSTMIEESTLRHLLLEHYKSGVELWPPFPVPPEMLY